MTKKMELVVASPEATAVVDPSSGTELGASHTQTAQAVIEAVHNKPPEPLLDTTNPFPKSSPVLPTLPIPKEVDPVLAKILTWKRAHLSESELGFRKWLKDEIKVRGGEPLDEEQGNILVQVRHAMKPGEKEGAVAFQLFSCHIDTMHEQAKKGDTWLQKITYDPNFGHIFLSVEDKKAGNCLGADDGAGVWIMLEMIQAGVPGNYLFHVGEERGFVGANAMLWNRKSWLGSFKHAIAFDRPVPGDVVTTQGGQRCCSDGFSDALAKALNDVGSGLTMAGRKAGGVTDTSKYTTLIPECTNVGVGYWAQHGKEETLDYGYLVRLRDACIRVDWAALHVSRDPKVVDYGTNYGNYGTYSRSSHQRAYSDGYKPSRQGSLGLQDDDSNELEAYWRSKQKQQVKKGKGGAKVTPTVREPSINDELGDMTFDDVVQFCEDEPREAASLLIDFASEVEALKAKINYLKGVLK